MVTLERTGERCIPELWACDERDLSAHLARYVFALRYCTDLNVLDCSCGTGYGSMILSWVASSVVGLDISMRTIRYAQQKYGNDKTSFRYGNAMDMPLSDNSFDIVVSLETIEHLKYPEAFLRECGRVLKDHGHLLVSAPENSGSSWHVRDYTSEELTAVVQRYFVIQQCWTQGPRTEIVESSQPLWEHPTWLVLAHK